MAKIEFESLPLGEGDGFGSVCLVGADCDAEVVLSVVVGLSVRAGIVLREEAFDGHVVVRGRRCAAHLLAGVEGAG